MLACTHKARRYAKLLKLFCWTPAKLKRHDLLMFAANRTTTDVTSTSTSLQITTMEFYKLSCVFVCGISIKHAIMDSMFVVIDTSKCPTRLAATLLPLSKHRN